MALPHERLLAEANGLIDEVFELEEINSEFAQADVAFRVIGANDVHQSAAEENKTLADLWHDRSAGVEGGTVMCIKRSWPGYAGIDNPLVLPRQTMLCSARPPRR